MSEKLKFKVGDRVKVIKCFWDEEGLTTNYLNLIGVIIEIKERSLFPYVVSFKNANKGNNIYSEEEIELFYPVLKKFLKEKRK